MRWIGVRAWLAGAAIAGLGVAACRERAREPAADAAAPVEVPAPPSAAVAPSAAPPEPAPEPKADSLVVLMGGDVSLGRGAGQQILANPDYDPFHAIAPLLKRADLVMVNLESQLSDQKGETQHPQNFLVFTGPPGGARTLARAGVDLVSLANNHAWDYGKSAFLETLGHLEAAGVAYTGAHREPNRAYEPTVIRSRGFSVAVFGVTHIWNQGPIQQHQGRFHVAWAAFDLLGKQLRRARKEHDLVLVSYHGGGEYVDVPMQWTRELINAVMHAGADVVFGHHPHVPHGVAWYGDKPAFYSLGNLVFAMHSDYPWTGTSFMARVTFHKDGKLQVEACPYHILGHVPMLFEGKSRAARERAFAAHLKQLSVGVGGTSLGEPGEQSCVPLAPPVKKPRPGAPR